MKKSKIHMQLSPVIFWDVDYKAIDFEKNAAFVIARVATLGRVSDWRAIQSYYGNERITAEVVQVRDLDAITLSFLSCVLDIPKEKFRCYTNQQSTPKHWNF